MRCQHDDNLGRIPRFSLLSEQIFQYRNVLQTRNAVERHCFRVRDDSAKNVGFAFYKPDFVLNLTVGEDGLRNTGDGSISGECSNLNHHGHRNFTIEQHSWRDIEVNTHIDELKVDHRRACGPDKCRLKGS